MPGLDPSPERWTMKSIKKSVAPMRFALTEGKIHLDSSKPSQ